MLRWFFLSIVSFTLLIESAAVGFAACPLNSEPYSETHQGAETTIHCQCSRGFVRRGADCISVRALGVPDPVCMKESGLALDIRLKGCGTKMNSCLDDADINSKMEQCAAAMFFNSAETFASAVLLPAATPWVARIEFARALNSCGFQFSAAERARNKCNNVLDECQKNLDYGKHLADECK